jgi:hypothetical protein
LSAVIVVLAIVGFYAAVQWGYTVYRLPHVIAPPFSFLIVEIREAKDSPILRARIFLDDVTDPSKVKFEGSSLKWETAKIPYSRATVPFNGFIVTGTGSMLFGKSRIDIDNDSITINGEDIEPIEFTVARNGVFRVGDIRIAR